MSLESLLRAQLNKDNQEQVKQRSVQATNALTKEGVGISVDAENKLLSACLLSALSSIHPTSVTSTESAQKATPAEEPLRSGYGSQDKTPVALEPPPVSNTMRYGGQMLESRQALPVFAHRAALVQTISHNQFVVVDGETGSGKSTQVPQYLLEEAASSRSPCNIICTQPRRLAAISLAERVAEERGEKIGQTIGYAVRMDTATSAYTRLLFATVGVLLRQLESDARLQDVTHVIVDEVHERSVEIDFLLLLLRDLCTKRHDFRVVLMSATFDAESFQQYFSADVGVGGSTCPLVTVSGRTFPVEGLYLEDALEFTQYDASHSAGSSAALTNPSSNDAVEDIDPSTVDNRYSSYSISVRSAIKVLDPDSINYALIADVVSNLSNRPPPAIGATAILVFLPGASEIQKMIRYLLACPTFASEPARNWVLPLHGSLPPEQQRWAFARAPQPVRKIVCCTNVAETSVTIDDVGVVVDSGRMKEMRFDPERRVTSLVDCLISRANARQRRGRAGRVAPGIAVHLFTRHRHDELMDERMLPEVRRVPLIQLVLRILATFGKSSVASVCSRLIEPPSREAVVQSLTELEEMEAVKGDGQQHVLTALGEHLARLPIDPRIGKLIILGAVFGPDATDKALTVAAALTTKWPFASAPDLRDKCREWQLWFANKMVQGGMESDHLAVLQAYMDWEEAYDKQAFCKDNFLVFRTMQEISAVKQNLLAHLSSAGFVREGWTVTSIADLGKNDKLQTDGVRIALGCNKDSRKAPPALIAALLCAALFPKIVWIVQRQGRTKQTYNAFYARVSDNTEPTEVGIHPSSVRAGSTKFGSPYLAYSELVQTSWIFARGVTPVSPLALLLFGGHLGTDNAAEDLPEGQAMLTVAGWIRFSVKKATQSLFLEVRQQIDNLFKQKIEQPDLELGLPGNILDTVAKLLAEPSTMLCGEMAPEQSSEDKTAVDAEQEAKIKGSRTHWKYRFIHKPEEFFGPFNGHQMLKWKQAQMFAIHPIQTCQCSPDGSLLYPEKWMPADKVVYVPGFDDAPKEESKDAQVDSDAQPPEPEAKPKRRSMFDMSPLDILIQKARDRSRSRERAEKWSDSGWRGGSDKWSDSGWQNSDRTSAKSRECWREGGGSDDWNSGGWQTRDRGRGDASSGRAGWAGSRREDTESDGWNAGGWQSSNRWR